MDSPLAHALNAAIQPKLVEVGWSTGGADDSALSEYIILMLVNGKTQEQIAAELSGDLLNLGPDDPGARDFSQWLFRQVDILNSHQIGASGGILTDGARPAEAGAQDADMGDVSDVGDSNVYEFPAMDPCSQSPVSLLLPKHTLTHCRPTGPKSMRTGPNRPRDKRMLGHLAKAMDRSNESVLHRVRPQSGNERINTHARPGPPTGPRQQQAPGRGGPRMVNARMNGHMGGMPMQPNSAAANIFQLAPQQQLELVTLLEQQAKIMSQFVQPQQQQLMAMGRGGPMGMPNGYAQQQSGRSLFDRVQPNSRPQNGFQRGPRNNKFGDNQQSHNIEDPSSSTDVEMSQEKQELDPENTTCRFNLSCSNKDCKFAHQSPAAPPGVSIDYKDVCSFGAACKNRKCTGKHPSPAQKIAHQTELDCKFFPNCTNPRCQFRHPSMPLCRNGADCTTPNCKFTHVKTMCKFNPCLNPACTFKHIEGQKRGKFEDKVWTADGAKEHVSERKFVDEDAPEELIVPVAAEGSSNETSAAIGVTT